MTISNGTVADAQDIEKNIITYLEGINQSTILAQNAGVTDKTYTYAVSDTFSDSNGYNNTIDTGNSTGLFDTDRYFAVQNSADESDATANSTFDNSYTLAKTITLASYKRVTQHVNDIKTSGVATGYCKVKFYYTDGTTSEVVNSTNSTTYVSKTYTNSSTNKLVTKIEIYLQAGASDWVQEANDVITAYNFTNGVVQTNSTTFSSNVKSILVNANKVLNGNSTITVDVSTDGGTTWDVTGKDLDTVIELDGDDTDVVVKFNLNVDSGNTPELYGYSYQIWT